MIELLVRGGLPYTLPLTGVAAAVLAAAGWAGAARLHGRDDALFRRSLVLQIGLFGLVFGFFSHAVSLYQMMRAVEMVGSVSPALVAGGLRASLIAPAYGLGIFVVAMLVWLALGLGAPRGTAAATREVQA